MRDSRCDYSSVVDGDDKLVKYRGSTLSFKLLSTRFSLLFSLINRHDESRLLGHMTASAEKVFIGGPSFILIGGHV